LNLIVRYTDGTNGDFDKIPTTDAGVVRFVSAPSKSIKGLYGIWFDGSTTLFYDECGIFEGDVQAADFTPYVKHTLPIPEAVRPKHGIPNTDVYDSIEWGEDGKQRSRVKCGVVDLGTLTWEYNGTASMGQCDISGIASGTSNLLLSNGDYVYSVLAGTTSDPNMTFYVYKQTLFLKNTDYTTAAAYKTAMSGVMLVYELATPITEDISDIMPADNYIGVEGGGTLTFVNEYGYDVPSEVTYQIKGVTA
jgi:hypothetical protein